MSSLISGCHGSETSVVWMRILSLTSWGTFKNVVKLILGLGRTLKASFTKWSYKSYQMFMNEKICLWYLFSFILMKGWLSECFLSRLDHRPPRHSSDDFIPEGQTLRKTLIMYADNGLAPPLNTCWNEKNSADNRITPLSVHRWSEWRETVCQTTVSLKSPESIPTCFAPNVSTGLIRDKPLFLYIYIFFGGDTHKRPVILGTSTAWSAGFCFRHQKLDIHFAAESYF